MIATFNGCSRSEITVTPANWKTKKANVKKPWRIIYRFYDPAFKGTDDWGKQIPIKGMNKYTTLEERQAITQGLIDNELDLLDKKAFHPIRKVFMETCSDEEESEISGNTPFLKALEWARVSVKIEESTRTDMKSVLKYMTLSAARVNKCGLEIKVVGRKDILRMFDNMKYLEATLPKKNKPARKKIWNDNQHNHYRKYLHILFGFLVREEIIENNPIDHIAIKEIVTDDESGRAILTLEQRRKINVYLKAKRPNYLRFVNIFFHSGCRSTEIMKLRGKHVNLARQTFRVLVKKKKKWSWETKTIKDIALPYWQQIMEKCRPEDYVFSVGLVPGPNPIRPEQPSRQWKRHVKDALGIEVDFYALKKLHTTEVMDVLEGELNTADAAKEAADHNSHAPAMVVNIYDAKKVERKNNKIRGVKNEFA